MTRYLLIFLLVFTSCLSAATLYKVVKKDGTVIYTDRPADGAEEVTFKGLNSGVMPSMANQKGASGPGRKKVERKLTEYQMAMISPKNGETVRNNQGNLNVTAQLTPAGTGEFLLFLDDQLYETKSIPSFSLTNLDRGEHSVQVKFKHNSGKILASTPRQTVFLHRASLLINAN